MISVLIVDDHPVVREGIKQIISETDDIVVDGEAASGHDALDLIKNVHFDAVLLDISMPGMGGLEVLKRIVREREGLPVLILSIHPEEQYAVRSLKAGAAGYLTKGSAPDELVTAIRQISAGGTYVSASQSPRLEALTRGKGPLKLPHEVLSDREFEVLRLIAQGKAVGVIAQELELSPKTVSTYRARILSKMKLKDNSELMRYAFEHGLVK